MDKQEWITSTKEYEKNLRSKRRIIDLAWMRFIEYRNCMSNTIMEDWDEQYGYFL